MATKSHTPTPKPGQVGRTVARLLGRKRPLSYAAIAERVQAEVPGAHTTARSVASIASALRSAGQALPDRRLAH